MKSAMPNIVQSVLNWKDSRPRINPGTPLTPGQKRMIGRLYLEGWGLVDIASEVKTDESTVSRYLRGSA